MSIMQTIEANRANRRPSFVRPGGSSRDLQRERENTRQQYFSGRKDVSPKRLDNRKTQETLVNQFKDRYTKPVGITNPLTGKLTGTVGGSNVYQMTPDAPMSLSDFQMQTANRFGPTLKEIGSDIRYGLGNIAQGFGDFAVKGGAMGSVLSDLFSRVKSGTAEGVETVKGLYDNLRKNLSREPTVTSGGGSTIFTTTEEPFQDLTREKIQTQPIDYLIPPPPIGDESDPSIFGLDAEPNDPFRNQQVFEPIRVSDMDKGLLASNIGQNVLGNLQNLRNLANQSNLRNIQFDPLNPNRIGYADNFMFNQTPVNYNIFATPKEVGAGLNFTFKDGGSVDKYAGLGYKLK
jgi:hypothetical protein